jgi:hypothetical protein
MITLNKYWLIKEIPEFKGVNETTGDELVFKNWRFNVVEVFAEDERGAILVAEITGIIMGFHYNDIIKEEGCV